jgi:LEA14-like dessication related protein
MRNDAWLRTRAPASRTALPRARARARAWGWVIALLTLAAALSGCASLVPKLAPPTLGITGVSIGGGNLQQQQVRLTFHATNPNDRAIPVRSIECSLELAGAPFAEGATDASFTLPPLGAVDFDMNVTANLSNVLPALLGGIGRRPIDYRVHGQVHLQGGWVRNIPFDQKGSVRL